MAGLLTRAQMENEALDNVAKSGLLTLQSGATLGSRMTTWVNRSQLWISRKAELLQSTMTTSTVANQKTYSFPSNLRNVYTMRLIDGLNSRKLTAIMPWETDRRIPYPEGTTVARSAFYIPYKRTLTFELFPIPQDVYSLVLRCGLYPVDMAASTDVSQFDRCDDAIVAYATMFAFRWLQELKDAKDWENYGDTILKDIITDADEAELYLDWAPVADGFATGPAGYTGESWNNPFVRDNSLNGWR